MKLLLTKQLLTVTSREEFRPPFQQILPRALNCVEIILPTCKALYLSASRTSISCPHLRLIIDLEISQATESFSPCESAVATADDDINVIVGAVPLIPTKLAATARLWMRLVFHCCSIESFTAADLRTVLSEADTKT